MAYTPEQINVIRTIIGEGQRRYGNIMAGPGRTKVLSALATAAVEQSFRNQPGGGGTSSGWRQETASSYPNVNRLDLHGSVNRYYNEVDQNFGRYHGAPGALAQSVQRSAYPSRYSQHIGEAAGLIRRFGGKGAAGAAGGGSRTITAPGFTAPGSATVSKTVQTQQTADMSRIAQLSQELAQHPQMAPASVPAPPGFSAGLHMAGGGIAALPITPPPDKRSMIQSELTDLLSKQQESVPLNVSGSASTSVKVPGASMTVPGAGGAAPAGFKAKAHYAVARRWTPAQIINNLVIPVAHGVGANGSAIGSLTPGNVAAANHQHGATVSGGRSDHQGPPGTAWAADINGSKPAMARLARSLASIFGIPWSGAGLVTKQFGPYRLQLIHNTMAGGNHYTHVHFGIRRG